MPNPKSKNILLVSLALVVLVGSMLTRSVANTQGQTTLTPSWFSYLPLILYQPTPTNAPTPIITPTPTRTPTPTPTPTPTQTSGANLQCVQNGATQICAWVSNGSPPRNSTVTVYGRLLVSGIGQPNQAMNATWHYKSTTPTCNGVTDSSGVAQCSRSIGQATIGYQVNIGVSIADNTATTWFTPY